MTGVPMTLAVAHYDRHVPLLDGTVGVEGVDLTVLSVGQSIPGRDGTARHERMLRDREFDAAEVSLSSYLLARQRGEPVIAIPVVPRRLFSASLFYCLSDSPLQGPANLASKRVGINTYQIRSGTRRPRGERGECADPRAIRRQRRVHPGSSGPVGCHTRCWSTARAASRVDDCRGGQKTEVREDGSV